MDAAGKPVRFVAGPGQQGDVLRAAELIQGLEPGWVIADTAYDANHFHESIEKAGAESVIKPRHNRIEVHSFPASIYKQRNLIERFFSKLKHFRRVATRYDKLLVNFIGFVTIAAIAITIR